MESWSSRTLVFVSPQGGTAKLSEETTNSENPQRREQTERSEFLSGELQSEPEKASTDRIKR